MLKSFDVIIIGLGAMGSAALYHLAKRGKRVLGIDQSAPPHSLGSSHGKTRIIREAYFEHPSYVPLVQRAYELWNALEKDSGTKLFQQTGGLMIGPEDGVVFNGARQSAEMHGLSHEVLSGQEVYRRFPVLRPADNMAAVWEPRAGFLFPEACIRAHLDLAQNAGASMELNQCVAGWENGGDGFVVESETKKWTAASLVVSAGSWLPKLVPDLPLTIQIERQVLHWFEPLSDGFGLGKCPVHLWEYERGRFFYGFPDIGEGVKAALHHEGASADPDQLNRLVSRVDVDSIRRILGEFIPMANGPLRSSTVCLYTNTPTHHFLIDQHPKRSGLWIISPCSGHGFKFASAIGEITAELVEKGESHFDLSLFRLPQFERL